MLRSVRSFASYVADAHRVDAPTFASRFDHLFLVKRPRDRAAAASASAIEYRTALVRCRPEAETLEGEAFARSWLVEPVRKREGNPFPDRVSIGRAVNCDIVLRVPYVSKLHAHLLLEDGAPMRLADLRSANGTWVNGRELSPGEIVGVAAGDMLRFGAAELRIATSAQLHALLLSVEVPSA